MEKDIGKIKKNDSTEIIVRIDDFGGKPGLTIREYTTSEKYTGFTKSGTRIPADSFMDFRNIINTIDEKDFLVQSAKSEIKEDIKQEILLEKHKKSKKNIENEPKEEIF